MKILLEAFERSGKGIDYYALDLSQPELKRTLAAVDQSYNHVRCHGLFGTYDDGLAWLKRPENVDRPKCVLWMGSSIGNLDRTEAADFLLNFTSILGPHDSLLIGIDACQDQDKVYHAYNDNVGKTREFYLNGLVHANEILGQEVFKANEWDVIGEYDAEHNRHHAFYCPTKDFNFEGNVIKAGTRIKFEDSFKYSPSQINTLWQAAGLMPRAKFGNTSDDFRKSHWLSYANPFVYRLHLAVVCQF